MSDQSRELGGEVLEQLDDRVTVWSFCVVVGLFLAAFMTVFQPFGVTNHDPDFRITALFAGLMLAIGAVVTLVLAVNEFWLRPRLLPERQPLNMALWLAWVYVLVGTTVFLVYNAVGSWHDFHLLSWLGFIRDVGMVITFPVLGFWFHLRHRALQSRYVSLRSSAPQSSGQMLSFTSENGKDRLVISVDAVQFLESEDNYVTVHYLDDGKLATHLLRSTLKRLETLVNEPNLVRCHRSYIVNLGRVASCRGNRHGLHLRLEGMSGVVPVSRSCTEQVLERLQAVPA